MILLLEFGGNLTIIAMLFYLRNPTIVSMFFYFEFEANLNIVATLFLSEKANQFFNDFLA